MALIPTTAAPDDYRRKLAYKLMMEGTDASPVQHWAQGLARLGQGALGGYEMYQADQRDREDLDGAAKMRMDINGFGGQDAPQAAPAAPTAAPMAAPMAAPGGTARPTTGKIYNQDELNPIDGPSPQDRRLMTATILGESANQPAEGMNAVASVIRNRAVDGGYGGDTPGGVVTAKNQFEPWNTVAGRAKMEKMLANPELVAKADQAIAQAYGEGGQAPNDPTNGAMNFFAPKAQAALGRQAPAWDGPGQMIGDHKFIGGKPQPGQEPYQVAGPPHAAPQAQAQAQALAPQAAPQDPRMAKVIHYLQNGTPAQKRAAIGIVDQIAAQQAAANKPTDEIREYEYNRKNPGFGEYKTNLKKAGATNVTTNTNVGGGSDKQIFDTMDESAKEARTTAAGLTGLREARAAVQAGAITGAGANQVLGLQKIGAALGIANSDKIVNTETFRAAIAPQIAAILKSTVGTANISNTDREFAEKAAGGNITLDEKSITRLMDIMERASVGRLEAHQKKVDKIYSDPEKFGRERALFGVDMPPAPAPVAPQPVKAAPTIPQSGEIRGGYRFKGGNPADPKSWEQIS